MFPSSNYWNDFVVGIASNLAVDFLKTLKEKLEQAAFGDDELRALERVYKHAFSLMLSQTAPIIGKELAEHLTDVLKGAVRDEEFANMLLDIAVHGRQPALPRLVSRFETIGFDSKTLPISVERVMGGLIFGLIEGLQKEAALPNNPLYNRVSLGRLTAIGILLQEGLKNWDEVANTIEKLENSIGRLDSALNNPQLLERTDINLSPELRVLTENIQRSVQDVRLNITVDSVPKIEGNILGELRRVKTVPMQRPRKVVFFENRKDLLESIFEALRPTNVVTLSGAGGVGKTAIATQVIWEIAPGEAAPPQFPGGIIFYSFYGQPSVVAAMEHIVRSYGAVIQPNPEAAVRRVLSEHIPLIVLDGAEIADDLERILDCCGNCGVLITTRNRQDAPDPTRRYDVYPLGKEYSKSLLISWSGKTIKDSVADEICELVGGLPLAVRLAGHYINQADEDPRNYLDWLKLTTLQALEQRQRHNQSVQIMLQHSVDVLTQGARDILTIAGVLNFAPFTIGLLTSVLGVNHIHQRLRLGQLINFGLVIRFGERYRLTHPLIRTFAANHLVANQEVLNRIIEYYVTMVERESERGKEGYSVLNHERPHIMKILELLKEQDQWDRVFEIANSIDEFLDLQGHWTDRLEAAEYCVQAAKESGDKRKLGFYIGRKGWVFRNSGVFDRAIECYEESLEIAQEEYNLAEIANQFGNIGSAYSMWGEQYKAIQYYEQANSIARQINDKKGEGRHTGNLGTAYNELGQPERAIPYFETAISLVRSVKDRRLEGAHLGNLGRSYAALGQYDKALENYSKALDIAREIGERARIARQLDNIGRLNSQQGNYQEAISIHEEALAIGSEIGFTRNEESNLCNLGIAHLLLGQFADAISCFNKAHEIAIRTGHKWGEAIHYYNIAIVSLATHQYEEAIIALKDARNIFRELDQHPVNIDELIDQVQGWDKGSIVTLASLKPLSFQTTNKHRRVRRAMEQQIEILIRIAEEQGVIDQLERNKSLAPFTSMKTGGPAELYVQVASKESLVQWALIARESDVPYTLFGGGSNMLVSDRGINGLVIHNRANKISFEKTNDPGVVIARAESGANFVAFARQAIREGLAGLEWATTIPGTVGGAIVGNSGAYGGDMTDNLVEAEVLLEDGTIVIMTQDDLNYTYRYSALKERVYRTEAPPVVLSGTFALPLGDREESEVQAQKNLEHRLRTQPREPSVGSVFKNPPDDYAGRLIEAVGLKGHKIGGMQWSTLHANWVVNMGDGMSDEVIQLINLARKVVNEKFEILLVPEILFVGDWDKFPPYD